MTPDADIELAIREVLARELKKEVLTFQQLKGGRNSRVFRVDCSDGSAVAVKAYFQSDRDRRDRMGCEFGALRFLKAAGVTQVATPLTADSERRVAVYEFVDGQALDAPKIGGAEIDQAVAFLRKLKNIAGAGGAEHFPAASEACFSIRAILESVDGRFDVLQQASKEEPKLADFLQKEYAPFRVRAEEWCRAFCQDNGVDPQTEIPVAARTLSPSDFGFHNALALADGRLVFLDFEYFGWDDPAKTVADFLLHPGMQLSRELKQRFFAGMISAFDGVPSLERRARAVYPLFGLKWCAILLNEFTFEHLARRRFAGNIGGALSESAQLEKARRMLATIIHDLCDFPYRA